MITTLIAALLVAIAAPWLRRLYWGVPFSLLSFGTVLVSSVAALLSVLLLGAAANFVLRYTPLAPERLDLVSGLIACAGGCVLVLASARKLRDVRGLSVLCQRIDEPEVRETSLAALQQLLDRVKTQGSDRYASFVLMATTALTKADLWDDARSRLQDAAAQTLKPQQQALVNQALATCALHFDDLREAEGAIGRISRPSESPVEIWLVAIEALLAALRGQADDALAMIESQDTEANPSLRASHRIVRAHALAAKSDPSAAMQELRILKDEAGEVGLERVLRPSGPASPLARELLGAA